MYRFEDADYLFVRCGAHDDDPDYDGEPCERCLELIDQARAEAETAAMTLERDSGAIAWAEAVVIVAQPLPHEETLRADCEKYYRYRGFEERPGKAGLVAFARHNYTNYDALLAELEESFPAVRGGDAYLVLRERVDEVVEDLLCGADADAGESVQDEAPESTIAEEAPSEEGGA